MKIKRKFQLNNNYDIKETIYCKLTFKYKIPPVCCEG